MLQEFITKFNQRLKARILKYLDLDNVDLMLDNRMTQLVESSTFECTIDASVDARIEEYDYSSIVESCLCEMDLSCMIENTLEGVDLGDHVNIDELSKAVAEQIADALRYSL